MLMMKCFRMPLLISMATRLQQKAVEGLGITVTCISVLMCTRFLTVCAPPCLYVSLTPAQ